MRHTGRFAGEELFDRGGEFRMSEPVGRYRLDRLQAGLPLSGLPLPPWLRRRLRRSTVLFGFGRERSSAEVSLDGRHLRSDAGRAQDPELYRALDDTTAALTAAYGARRAIATDVSRAGRRRALILLGLFLVIRALARPALSSGRPAVA